MYTSTIISTIFAAVAIAAPANNVANNEPRAEARVQAAQANLDALVANGCNVLGCLAAVAPASATCAAALAEAGANPVADIACFAGVVATMSNPVSKHG
ncbi:uncharacterized protein N0V89_003242 [Didymosphaeria variabile]|uniref:Fungal calcium binding protein domain-containing protein n=1 Tax=Didymosphaeria variabile TaxID=1932322 RepID=A0A9W9CFC3_9PLEO|nr:uncharacterized protein N0V89_003242 [Didymosphaeria variabile]KAJ4358658.1 hypothetical protein N0V89_003242 [Didymosphaeria variabile]